MSDLGKAIRTILINDATTTAIIGTRVYPKISPQSKGMPYVAYSMINVNPSATKDSTSAVDQVRLQLDIITDGTVATGGYEQLMALNTSIRGALARYPHGTVSGVILDGVEFINEQDDYDEDINVFIHIQEYYVRVKY